MFSKRNEAKMKKFEELERLIQIYDDLTNSPASGLPVSHYDLLVVLTAIHRALLIAAEQNE